MYRILSFDDPLLRIGLFIECEEVCVCWSCSLCRPFWRYPARSTHTTPARTPSWQGWRSCSVETESAEPMLDQCIRKQYLKEWHDIVYEISMHAFIWKDSRCVWPIDGDFSWSNLQCSSINQERQSEESNQLQHDFMPVCCVCQCEQSCFSATVSSTCSSISVILETFE